MKTDDLVFTIEGCPNCDEPGYLLCKALSKTIDDHIEQHGLSVARIVGSLEVVKLERYNEGHQLMEALVESLETPKH